MAKIRREALDDAERSRYDAAHHPTQAPRRPSIHVPDVTPTRGPLALGLVVLGVGAQFLALGAVAALVGAGAAVLGGYLLGRSVGASPASVERERGFLFAERQELTRAALAIVSLRGSDGGSGSAEPQPARAEPPQPGISGPAYLAARRAALRALDGPAPDPDGESLELDADAGAL